MLTLIDIVIIITAISFLISFGLCFIGVLRGIGIKSHLQENHPGHYENYKPNFLISPYTLDRILHKIAEPENDAELIAMIDEFKPARRRCIFFFILNIGLLILTITLLLFRS